MKKTKRFLTMLLSALTFMLALPTSVSASESEDFGIYANVTVTASVPEDFIEDVSFTLTSTNEEKPQEQTALLEKIYRHTGSIVLISSLYHPETFVPTVSFRGMENYIVEVEESYTIGKEEYAINFVIRKPVLTTETGEEEPAGDSSYVSTHAPGSLDPETGLLWADDVFNAFVSKMAFLKDAEALAKINFASETLFNDLHGSEMGAIWGDMSGFDRFVWWQTYCSPFVELTNSNYKSEEEFLSHSSIITTSLEARFPGKGEVYEEAYTELLSWLWQYWTKYGKVYNFYENRTFTNVDDGVAFVSENKDTETESGAPAGGDNTEEDISGGDTETDEQDGEESTGNTFVSILTKYWFSILVVIGMAVFGIVMYFKTKAKRDDI